MLPAASILVRIIANPVSNVFQKLAVGRGASALFVIVATHALLALAVVPLLLLNTLPSDSGFWGNMALCALLAAASNALHVQAMKLADLSVLGPINAYKAVVSLLPAVVLLGEIPNLQTIFGIGLIVAGSYFLTDPKPATSATETSSRGPWLSLGVRYRLAALVLSATEAVFLKRALAYASPTTAFAWWAVLGLVAAVLLGLLPYCRIDWGSEIQRCRNSPTLYLALAATTGLMQYCTLVAFATVQVAAALALFQTSAVVSVLLGHHIFREPHLARRLTGTLIMVAGAVLIVLSHATTTRY